MTLWIRTQDEKILIKCSEIVLDGKKIRCVSQEHPVGLVLGKYSGDDEAKGVFEQIQRKLTDSTQRSAFFKMPKSVNY